MDIKSDGFCKKWRSHRSYLCRRHDAARFPQNTNIWHDSVQVWLEFTILIKMIRQQFSYSLWSVSQKSILDWITQFGLHQLQQLINPQGDCGLGNRRTAPLTPPPSGTTWRQRSSRSEMIHSTRPSVSDPVDSEFISGSCLYVPHWSQSKSPLSRQHWTIFSF